MAYTDFSDKFYVQTLDTSETLKLGRFKVNESTELYHIVLHCFKKGTAGGSETFTLKVFGNPSYEGTALATSAAFTLSSASWFANTNGIGWLRFDFSGKQNLNPNNWYYLALTSASYTRNSDTYYLGAVLDWPQSVHSLNGAGPAAKFNIIGYRELD